MLEGRDALVLNPSGFQLGGSRTTGPIFKDQPLALFLGLPPPLFPLQATPLSLLRI